MAAQKKIILDLKISGIPVSGTLLVDDAPSREEVIHDEPATLGQVVWLRDNEPAFETMTLKEAQRLIGNTKKKYESMKPVHVEGAQPVISAEGVRAIQQSIDIRREERKKRGRPRKLKEV